MTLYQILVQPRTLARSWTRLQTKGPTPGIDGVTFETFAAEAAARLQRLAVELAGGSYRPQPLRGFTLPKAEGGSRTIGVATVRDRVVQGAALLLLMPYVESLLQPCSYAYRPGRSHQDALAAVRALREEGFHWIAEADVEAFFDSIPHGPCLQAVRNIVDDTPFLALLEAWLTTPIVGAADPRTPGRGLPQGLCLSPLLSNLYLDPFDRAMTGVRHRLIRFADDFVVMCRSRAAAYAALRDAERALQHLDLRLNSQKSSVTSFDQGFAFLGGQFEGAPGLEVGFTPAPRAAFAASPFARPVPPAFTSTHTRPVAMPAPDPHPEPADDPLAYTEARPPAPAVAPPANTEAPLPKAALPPALHAEPDFSWDESDPETSVFDVKEPHETDAEGVESERTEALAENPFFLDPVDGKVDEPGPGPGLGRRGPATRTLYVNRQGCLVRTKLGRYEITHPDEPAPILSVPAVQVGEIVVVGAGTLTAGAVRRCLRDDIPVHFVAMGGRYYGGLIGEKGHDAARLQAQVLASTQPEAALDLARRFVYGKIRNQVALLRRVLNRDPDPVLQETVAEHARLLRALRRSKSVDGVRGVEGAAAAAYFGVFDRFIRVPELTFPGRVRRPPTDPVNALLSFGYTLLHSRLHALVRLRRLHPFVGFLHTPKQGHAALVSDLQEEWRPLIDALVLSAVNRREFLPSVFREDGAGGLLLDDEARRRFVTRFEGFLERRYRATPSGRRLTYVHRIDVQVRRLVRHLEDGVPYVPFRWR